ncbi:MAG: glycosyltransferase [Candidatus Magasanikbacteria bacterium]
MKKILLTGGETGGHIYPLIAISQEIKEEAFFSSIDIEYIGPKSKHTKEFKKMGIKTHKITGAKIRRYFSFKNILAIPKFIFSIFEALAKLFFIMPEVVLIKGGSGSLPISIAAKFYLIPIIVHESDSIPSLTTKKGTVTGNPIRKKVKNINTSQNGAKKRLNFDIKKPLIFVMGGSQGSKRINEVILNNLEKFISDYQILHQVGLKNAKKVSKLFKSFSKNWPEEKRKKYQWKGLLSAEEMGLAYKASDLIISRAGSAIFEIAKFGKPSILIPLEESAQDHQRKNAYNYAQNGASEVLEEANFTANLLLERIKKITHNKDYYKKMSKSARKFANKDSAKLLSKEILNLIK